MDAGTQPVAPPVAGRPKPWQRIIVLLVVAGIAGTGAGFYVLFLGPSRPPVNTPPYGLSIAISPWTGTNTTVFQFIATAHDNEDPETAVQVRWDWENDGAWDTAFNASRSATHVFRIAGNHAVRMEARDTGGLTANTTRGLSVTLPPHLRVATVLSETGSLSVFGISQRQAVDMAVEEINVAGGVQGQPVEIFHQDDATSPSLALQAGMTVVTRDNVSVIIGSTGSAMCAAILPFVRQAHVLEVSPSCTSPMFSDLTFTGGWFARTVTSDALQGLVAAAYARTNLSIVRSGAIGINNVYGTEVATAYAQNFTRFGGTMTSGSPRIVQEAQSSYTMDLVAVLNVNPMPQVVYVAAYPANGIQLMRDWWTGVTTYPAWRTVTWLFSDGVYDQVGFIRPLVSCGVNVTGFFGTAPAAYAGYSPPPYGAWAARYATKYGQQPTILAANAYDAMYLVALAAQAAGSLTGDAIRAKLAVVANPPGVIVGPGDWSAMIAELAAARDINYEGASGPVNVNRFGDIAGPYVIWGVTSSNVLYTKEFFGESLVVGLAGGLFSPARVDFAPTSVVPVRRPK